MKQILIIMIILLLTGCSTPSTGHSITRITTPIDYCYESSYQSFLIDCKNMDINGSMIHLYNCKNRNEYYGAFKVEKRC